MNSIEKMRFTSENLCDILITLQENLAVFINRQRGRPWLPPQPLFYDGLFLPSSFPWGFPNRQPRKGKRGCSSLFLRNRPAALRLSVRDLDGEARAGPDEVVIADAAEPRHQKSRNNAPVRHTDRVLVRGEHRRNGLEVPREHQRRTLPRSGRGCARRPRSTSDTRASPSAPRSCASRNRRNPSPADPAAACAARRRKSRRASAPCAAGRSCSSVRLGIDAALRRRVQLLERLRQHRDVRRAVVEITQAALRLAVAQWVQFHFSSSVSPQNTRRTCTARRASSCSSTLCLSRQSRSPASIGRRRCPPRGRRRHPPRALRQILRCVGVPPRQLLQMETARARPAAPQPRGRNSLRFLNHIPAPPQSFP